MIGIFTLFNYQVSENLDEAFKKIISEHKLIKIEYSRNFFIRLFFDGGIEIETWNANKYYAWLSRGYIEKDGNTILSWDGERPKRRTMNKLIKAIKKYTQEKI